MTAMATADPAPGRDSRYCGGVKRQGEGTCTRPAGWGTPHPGSGRCKLHGGSTTSHQRKAERDAMLSAVETFGLPRETDPHTALLEELYRTVGAVEWLGAVVADLERRDVVWGITKDKVGGDDQGITSEAKPSAWVVLWHAERKHLVEVSKACISAGIEERRVRLAESQGALLAGVVQTILAAMYAALVEALGEYEAARVLVENLWPVLMGRIVPDAFRQVIEGGEGA